MTTLSSCKSRLLLGANILRLTSASRALVIGFGIIDKIEPFHQHFSLTDIALQYPFAVHERVPIPLLYFVSIVCPVGIIVLYTLILDGLFSHHKDQLPLRDGSRVLGRYRLKDRLWEMNCGILGLLLSLSSAFKLTEALKKATGKPRPDLIDRCQPLSGSHDPPVFGLSNITICTQTDSSILQDGFQSFPSGHSSSKLHTAALYEIRNREQSLTLSSLVLRSLLPLPIPCWQIAHFR